MEICERCCQKTRKCKWKVLCWKRPSNQTTSFDDYRCFFYTLPIASFLGKNRIQLFPRSHPQKPPSHFLEEKCTSFAYSKFKFRVFLCETEKFSRNPKNICKSMILSMLLLSFYLARENKFWDNEGGKKRGRVKVFRQFHVSIHWWKYGNGNKEMGELRIVKSS